MHVRVFHGRLCYLVCLFRFLMKDCNFIEWASWPNDDCTIHDWLTDWNMTAGHEMRHNAYGHTKIDSCSDSIDSQNSNDNNDNKDSPNRELHSVRQGPLARESAQREQAQEWPASESLLSRASEL